MKSFSEIEEICRKYKIKNYTINEDGSIDVDGNVDLEDKGLTELPLNFNKVSGYFDCNYNKLTTLKGSPKYVGYNFFCGYNELTSLKYSPEKVGGDFSCGSNIDLTSLEYSPKEVGNWFYCNDTEITDLCGISDNIGELLYCSNTPISSIITKEVDIYFIRAFNIYKVIKDGKVQLKRLKYLMKTFNMEYYLEEIKEYYEII